MEASSSLMASKQRYPVARRSYTSADQLSLRASGQEMDASEDLAQQYRQVGRRLVDPYAARAAEEAMRAARQRTLHAGVQVGPDTPYPAPNMRGWRSTQMGTYGRLTGYDRQPWDARLQAGYIDAGARGPGFADELDRAEKNRWQSGRLQQGSMTLHPSPDRPYLMLRCPDTSGNGTSSIHVRLEAGMMGGASSTREFFLGGGFTASFLLDGYATVRIEIVQTQNPGVDRLEWAWEISGVQAGDQSLYFPQRLILGPGVWFSIPEGAFEVLWSGPLANITWSNPNIPAWVVDKAAPPQFVSLPIIGSRINFAGGVNTPVLWRLRPI